MSDIIGTHSFLKMNFKFQKYGIPMTSLFKDQYFLYLTLAAVWELTCLLKPFFTGAVGEYVNNGREPFGMRR